MQYVDWVSKKNKNYHLYGGTFSMISIRSTSWVLFKTELRLGQMHLHRLSSYDCAYKETCSYFLYKTWDNTLHSSDEKHPQR